MQNFVLHNKPVTLLTTFTTIVTANTIIVVSFVVVAGAASLAALHQRSPVAAASRGDQSSCLHSSFSVHTIVSSKGVCFGRDDVCMYENQEKQRLRGY